MFPSVMKVLVVDDEEDIADLIRIHLEEDGFLVELCHNGMEVLGKIEKNQPQAIVLDLMLPGVNGTELCKRIKEKYSHIPIVMVTAKTTETDVVVGLELGADDYIRKPFSVRELVARVKAVIRRFNEPDPEENSANISSGKIEINQKAHRVTIDDSSVELTVIEYKLLYLFVANPGVAFSRDKLLDKIWGKDVFVTDRTVDVNIKRLRDKLGSEKERLETVRGIGYRFRDA